MFDLVLSISSKQSSSESALNKPSNFVDYKPSPERSHGQKLIELFIFVIRIRNLVGEGWGKGDADCCPDNNPAESNFKNKSLWESGLF
jgi:hypothetical protein